MLIFVSWSGSKSLAAAKALRRWLPDVIPAVRLWMSSEDIEKGNLWTTQLSKRLQECQFGIVCLTKQSISSEWVLFEFGALANIFASGRVCPLLIDLNFSEVTGPYAAFQATQAHDKDDVRRLVKTINRTLGARALKDHVVDAAFEREYPRLKAQFNTLKRTSAIPRPQQTHSIFVCQNNDELALEIRRYVAGLRKTSKKRIADIIQFSGQNAKGIAAALLDGGLDVRVHLGELRQAELLGNRHQADLIRSNRYVKFRNEAMPNEGKHGMGSMQFFRYNAPASIRAVHIPGHLVAVGTYLYEVRDIEQRFLDIRGGEKPMIVLTSAHPQFRMLSDMLTNLIKNWLKHEVTTPRGEEDLRPPPHDRAALEPARSREG